MDKIGELPQVKERELSTCLRSKFSGKWGRGLCSETLEAKPRCMTMTEVPGFL